MPTLIECQYVKIFDERRRDKVPPMRVRRSAMQEQERPLALAAVVKTIQREPVGGEAMRPHRALAISSLISKPTPPSHDDTFESRAFHATI
jgi:hypothetical protein